ncbi:WGR domain-containing protein [Nannocystis exedens]|uniref:WGR domain-containing protein n=1 Tax=Nannocystis exedens TaxID=54 RepID=A0A1I2I0B1_9BACT|nr:WGR domain-containing protein [Nannocystis exedens]PCC73517.1 WGR domain protein [Nannocystis exedens]SFF35692.1 WGR domain-containing protein [Nannocystis exedens]
MGATNHMTEKRRFELVEGSASKFWGITVEGKSMSVCYGRIGTAGSAKDKAFASEAEAEREAAKLELLTTLAKKAPLDPQSREESDEKQAKYEELYAAAQNVGLPKMPPKELKKAITTIQALMKPAEKLALALPLARQYAAERDLWGEVASAADDLKDWPLTAEAAANAKRLTPLAGPARLRVHARAGAAQTRPRRRGAGGGDDGDQGQAALPGAGDPDRHRAGVPRALPRARRSSARRATSCGSRSVRRRRIASSGRPRSRR